MGTEKMDVCINTKWFQVIGPGHYRPVDISGTFTMPITLRWTEKDGETVISVPM